MPSTLNLSPELEQYLLREANQLGLSIEAVALQFLADSIAFKQKQADRLSERQLFPLELKGVTW